jgi:DNA-binding transcriptional LysR family regulator
VNLSSIDLNLLLVLHTVLEEQSVARAAEKLSVTSSAVSNSLARLRAVLDDALFVRRGRRLAPTPRARKSGHGSPVAARAQLKTDVR